MGRFLCRHKLLTPLGKYQGASLLDYMVRVCLILEDTPKLFPKQPCHFASPPAMNESFCCCTSSPAFGDISVLDIDHPSRLPIFVNKFYWNTTIPSCLHTVYGCFGITVAEFSVAETLWLPQPEISTALAFTQSVCWSLQHGVAVTMSTCGMAIFHQADIQAIFSCFL